MSAYIPRMLTLLFLLCALWYTSAANIRKKKCPLKYCFAPCFNEPTAESCADKHKDFLPRTVSCGCCNNCVDYIGDNEKCGRDTNSSNFKKKCKPGSKCIGGFCRNIYTCLQ